MWTPTKASIFQVFENAAFLTKELDVRLNFIKKVFSILSVQLLITAIFVTGSCFSNDYKLFIRRNLWFFWVCLVVNIILLYVLVYVRTASRKVPINYCLLGLFTLTEAYLISCITAFTDPDSVFIAAALTAAIVVALTIYAFTTKKDFTICGGLLFTAVMGLFIGGILAAIFQNKLLDILVSVLSVIVFSIYLIFDTQLILGKSKLKLTIDDYIFAAMNLYIDIIRIFIEFLRIFGRSRRN